MGFHIVDLAADIGSKVKHVRPGGFIPGPNNPKNVDSFLFPGFHHIAALQMEGLRVWNALEDNLFTSYPFVYLGTADVPGSVHLTGLVGHGAFPCCLFCGIKGRHKPGVIIALLKPDNYSVAGCDHPDANVEEIQGGSAADYDKNLTFLLNSENLTDYKRH